MWGSFSPSERSEEPIRRRHAGKVFLESTDSDDEYAEDFTSLKSTISIDPAQAGNLDQRQYEELTRRSNSNTEDSQTLGTPKQPLLNSLVIYNIFTYLPRSDLLNSRLVCTAWDGEACRLLRKEMLLEFQDICHISKFKQLMDDNLARKPNQDSPFAKIYLRSTFRLGHDIAQDFFKAHGHFVKHLQIAKVGCDCGANFFQKLLFYQATNITSLDLQIISSPIRLSPNSEYTKYLRLRPSKRLSSKWRLPNLRHLRLRHQLFVERPKFIEDILESAINLEVLTTDEASPLFCRNIFIPKVLASRNRWNRLKQLLVGDFLYFSNEQLLKFAELKLHLEYLPVNFNILVPSLERLDAKNLMKLLVSLQDHLRGLELFNHRPDLPVDLSSFPYMKKLESLKVTNVSFPSASLQRFPNLKSLTVAHEDPTLYSSMLGLKIPPHSTLCSVRLYPVVALNLVQLRDWMTYWNSNAKIYVRELANAFPCLRALAVSGTDALLESIYENMPSLEALSIHGPITDEGITGIPLEMCKRMHSEQDYDLMDSDELEQLHFIGDLKKLRRLTVSAMGHRPLMSEVSVFLGFVCCTDLIQLEIGNRELTDLWKEEVKRQRSSYTLS